MLRQIVGVFANEVALRILGVVSAVIACRLLGPEQRGVMVIAILTAQLASAITYFGLPQSLTYHISRAKDRQLALKDAIGVSSRVIPFGLAVAALLYAAAYIFGRESLLKGLSLELVVLSYCFYAINFLHFVLRQVFLGLQDFLWRNVVALMPTLIIAIALVVVWLGAWPITAVTVVWFYVLSTALALVVGVFRFLRKYRPQIMFRTPVDWLQTHVWFGMKFYVALIAQTLNYRLDTLILKVLLGNAAVGLYTGGVSVAEMLLFVPSTLNFVFYPKVSSVTAAERHRLTALTVGFSLYAVAFGGVVLAAASPWIVPFLYGKDFLESIGPAQWLVPGMVSLAVVKVLCHAFAGAGRPEFATYTTTVGLVGTVALDLLLIPSYGIVGAAWASSIAYSIAAGVSIVLYLRLEKLSIEQLARDLAVQPVAWIHGQCRRYLATSQS